MESLQTKSFKGELNTKIELLTEVDRHTLYFDGFKDIQKEIRRIRKINLPSGSLSLSMI